MNVPTTRLARRATDLRLLQRATVHIDELNRALDRQLAAESLEAERMRLLREATNQITRAANDGIQAYRRVANAVRTEEARAGGVASDESRQLHAALEQARRDLLQVLEETSRRYPWATPWQNSEASAAEVSSAEA